MINKLLLAFAAVLMMAANSSYATLISGDVNFLNGGLATTDTGDLATANSITFPSGSTVAAGTGSFSGLSGAPVSWDIGTLDLTNTNPNLLFASFDVFSFVMESFTVNRFQISGSDFLSIGGLGIFSGTGWEASGGTFNITLQESGPNSQLAQFSFSSAAHSIPEPTTLAMLGLGLAGLGIARKRARK